MVTTLIHINPDMIMATTDITNAVIMVDDDDVLSVSE